MIKKTYKIIINGENSEEAFRAIWDVFETFGKVTNVEKFLNRDDATIFTMKTSRRKFKRMVKGIRSEGLNINECKGYYFM